MSKFLKSVMALAVSSFVSVAAVRAADTSAPSDTGQHAETFEKHVVIKLDYLLYLPPDYKQDADNKWPLVLFLHGSGERGSDVTKVKMHGPPKIVETRPDSVLAKKFVVVSPQCPEGKWWKADDLIDLLDDVEARYHVDKDRIYLTGLSMGGFGAWDLAANYPRRFAAVAPMCGGGNTALAHRMKSTPFWVFHGAADPTVPVQRSDEMVAALKDVGADVKFTKYPGVGHDCWTQSYANPELYSWFLSHKLGEAATQPAASK